MKICRGQTAIVTGASEGLGVHIAEALAAKGVNIVLAARNTEKLKNVQKHLLETYDIRSIAITTDISKQKDLETLVDETCKQFGTIDILVNNAGVEKTLWYGDITRDEISSTIDINLKGTMNLTHLVLPYMIRQNRGHVINISSGTGYLPMAYNEVYATTKAGIIGFTKSLRQSLQHRGCSVSASVVAPGFMDGSGMYQNMKDKHKVRAPRILGTRPIEALNKEIILAIEKDKPDVLISGSFSRLFVATSILSQRTIEKITNRFNVSEFFKTIADKG